MMRIGVMFSGGLDSTTSALRLRNKGYEVHLWHLTWCTARNFGNDQLEAAKRVANTLAMPLEILGTLQANASMRWQPILVAMGIEVARRKRMPAVAWGLSGENWGRPGHNDNWQELAAVTARLIGYTGEVLLPVWGTERSVQWSEMPRELQPLIWACHNRSFSRAPCGRCRKCNSDAAHRIEESQHASA